MLKTFTQSGHLLILKRIISDEIEFYIENDKKLIIKEAQFNVIPEHTNDNVKIDPIEKEYTQLCENRCLSRVRMVIMLCAFMESLINYIGVMHYGKEQFIKNFE